MRLLRSLILAVGLLSLAGAAGCGGSKAGGDNSTLGNGGGGGGDGDPCADPCKDDPCADPCKSPDPCANADDDDDDDDIENPCVGDDW